MTRALGWCITGHHDACIGVTISGAECSCLCHGDKHCKLCGEAIPSGFTCTSCGELF